MAGGAEGRRIRLRVSELKGLKMSDLDLESGLIRLQAHKTKTTSIYLKADINHRRKCYGGFDV